MKFVDYKSWFKLIGFNSFLSRSAECKQNQAELAEIKLAEPRKTGPNQSSETEQNWTKRRSRKVQCHSQVKRVRLFPKPRTLIQFPILSAGWAMKIMGICLFI